MDNDDNVFFSRQLEHIRAQVVEKKYSELKGTMFVPINSSVDAGAQVFTFRIFDARGMAKLVSDYAKDFPRVDVHGEEVTSSIKSIGDSYGYNLQEIRGARLANLKLEQRRANAARRAIDEKVDRIAQNGDDLPSTYGLLNQPNATTYSIPNGASGSPLWTNKTPDEICADIFGIVSNAVVLTKELEVPNTILLPIASFQLIAKKRMGDGSNDTILKHVKEKLAEAGTPCEIMQWYACDTAGSGGVKRMVAYKKDPEVLELILPITFEQFPPQQEGLEYKTMCHARSGGVVAYFPLGINYGDGI